MREKRRRFIGRMRALNSASLVLRTRRAAAQAVTPATTAARIPLVHVDADGLHVEPISTGAYT